MTLEPCAMACLCVCVCVCLTLEDSRTRHPDGVAGDAQGGHGRFLQPVRAAASVHAGCMHTMRFYEL